MAETGAPPRVLLIVAAGLAVALAVVVAVIGMTSSTDLGSPDPANSASPDANGPLALVAIPAPQASSRACRSLINAVPADLESAGRTLSPRKLAEPAPSATVAWGKNDPVVLRCGLDRPPELTRTAVLRDINGVRWLPVEGDGSASWYAVDRDVYVVLTLPANTGTGPLQQLSDTIRRTLPQRPLRFG